MMTKLVIAAFLALALCILVKSEDPLPPGGGATKLVKIGGKTVRIPVGVRVSKPGKPQSKPFDCVWVTGKATGFRNQAILAPPKSGQACVDQCYRMKGRKRGKKIDAVMEFVDESKAGCWCIHKVHDVDESLEEYKTCYFDKEKAEVAAASAAAVAASANACPGTGLVPKLEGCYKVNNRRRYFYNERLTIDWSQEGHVQYGNNFVCACADAAFKAGIEMFATHYWGECWELKKEDLGNESADGCLLADGLYKTKSCDDTDKACLGITDYGVYAYGLFQSSD